MRSENKLTHYYLNEKMKKRKRAGNWHFVLLLAGALLLLPGTMRAQTGSGHSFAREALAVRIGKIMKTYKVDITYEESLVKNSTAPALQNAASVDNTLTGSLAGTNLTYKKLNDKSYVITRSAAAPAPQQTAAKGKGTLSGTVVDKNGFPVPGATVIVAGTTTGTSTDVKGHYSLELPARTVSVEISCISYQKMSVSDIRITAGKTTPLDVVLQDVSEQLEEVVVTVTYNRASANGLYAKQKAMIAMSDGLSADLIKKTSDNNMAQVLKRVAGVTIDNGKYVTVRGMGERYNNVRLNGASLPSTEPNRRNFAFDVIPSGLVDNVTVAKTFTPDLPGEFTGGLIEVNTLSVPDEKFVNVNVGVGMNTISTGKDFLSNKRFKSDWLFGEINNRKWFVGRSEEGGKASVQEAARKNTFGMRKFTAMPIQSYSLTLGAPIELGYGHKLGVVAALTYRNEQTTEEYKEMNTIIKDSLNGPSNRYKWVTAIGAVANIGWKSLNHKITWRNMFNNRFQHTNQERYIHTYTTKMNTYEQYSVPLRSRLWQTQLEGEHRLFKENLIATWNASFNQVERTNPDDRYALGNVQGEVEDGFVDWTASINNNRFAIEDGHLMYSDLKEKKKNIGLNLEHPFVVRGNKQTVKAGYMGTFRTSDYEQQYLHAMPPDVRDQASWSEEAQKAWDELDASNPNLSDLYDPKNFTSQAIHYVPSGLSGSFAADFYEGKQHIHAAYLMGEFTFLRKLHLTAGVRMENAETKVFTTFYDPDLSKTLDSLVTVKKTDWLPAVTMVYNVTDQINARLAYSRTIARPDFRELTPCDYYNVDDRLEVTSRGGLKQSHADNFDFRLEWYPQAGEVVSVSAFYKNFKDPIEMVTRQTMDLKYVLHPFNIDDATVKGIEMNLRKSLAFIAPGSFLKDVYISGNATFLKGKVTYNLERLKNELFGGDGEVTTQDRRRPLQGLSPYMVNAGLVYQGKTFGAALNYGRNGRKLLFAGESERYDQYEASRDVLDLQISARFLKEKLEVKFNAGDLLNQDVITYRNCGYQKGNSDNDKEAYADLTSDMNYNQGDWVLSRIKKGVSLSLSVGYKF